VELQRKERPSLCSVVGPSGRMEQWEVAVGLHRSS
jgi:hypothetical protein